MKKALLISLIALSITACTPHKDEKSLPSDSDNQTSKLQAALDFNPIQPQGADKKESVELVGYKIIQFETRQPVYLDTIAQMMKSNKNISSRLIKNSEIIAFKNDSNNEKKFLTQLNEEISNITPVTGFMSSFFASSIGETVPYSNMQEVAYPKITTQEKTAKWHRAGVDGSVISTGTNMLLSTSKINGDYKLSLEIISTRLNGFENESLDGKEVRTPKVLKSKLKTEFTTNSNEYYLALVNGRYYLIKPDFKQ